MATEIEVSRGLVEWAGLAGFEFTPPSAVGDDWIHFTKGRPLFSNRGGETCYFIGAQDGWYVVTSSDRRSEEQLEFAAEDLGVVEKVLFGYLGEDIRSLRKLPELDMTIYTAGGFRIGYAEFVGKRKQALIDSEGRVVAIGSVYYLAPLSRCIDASIVDIKESFENPDGKPLFSLSENDGSDAASSAQQAAASEDVRELVRLIADDEYVNGVSEDVIANRTSWAKPKPAIRRDDTWDRYVYFFYVGQGMTKSSGFRYTDGKSVPLGASEETESRIEKVLARVRNAGNPPVAQKWNAAAITYDRRSGTGDAHFFYGPDAENWCLTSRNRDQIAARGLTLFH